MNSNTTLVSTISHQVFILIAFCSLLSCSTEDPEQKLKSITKKIEALDYINASHEIKAYKDKYFETLSIEKKIQFYRVAYDCYYELDSIALAYQTANELTSILNPSDSLYVFYFSEMIWLKTNLENRIPLDLIQEFETKIPLTPANRLKIDIIKQSLNSSFNLIDNDSLINLKFELKDDFSLKEMIRWFESRFNFNQTWSYFLKCEQDLSTLEKMIPTNKYWQNEIMLYKLSLSYLIENLEESDSLHAVVSGYRESMSPRQQNMLNTIEFNKMISLRNYSKVKDQYLLLSNYAKSIRNKKLLIEIQNNYLFSLAESTNTEDFLLVSAEFENSLNASPCPNYKILSLRHKSFLANKERNSLLTNALIDSMYSYLPSESVRSKYLTDILFLNRNNTPPTETGLKLLNNYLNQLAKDTLAYSPMLLIQYYTSQGNYYLRTNNKKEAENIIYKCLKIARENKFKSQEIYFLRNTIVNTGESFGPDSMATLLQQNEDFFYKNKEFEILNYLHYRLGTYYQNKQQLKQSNEEYIRSIYYSDLILAQSDSTSRRFVFEKNIVKYFSIMRNAYVDNNLDLAYEFAEKAKTRWLAIELNQQDEPYSIIPLKELQAKIPEKTLILELVNQANFMLFSILVGNDTAMMNRVRYGELFNRILELQSFKNYLEPHIKPEEFNLILKTDFSVAQGFTSQTKLLNRLFIQQYRELLETPFPDRNTILLVRQYGEILYDFFLKPYEDLLKKYDQLIFINNNNNILLPFETFIRDGKYLVETHSVSYTHSFSTWNYLNARQYPDRRKPILAMGNGTYNSKEKTKESRGLDAIRGIKGSISKDSLTKIIKSLSIDNLEFSQKELDNIKTSFPEAKIVSGDQLNEEYIMSQNRKENLKDYKIIHFSTHGIFVPYRSDLTSLVFPLKEGGKEDGLLSIRDIASLDLESDLVNLSACESGLAVAFEGEGISGLTYSFLLAGANNLSLSLWSISDKSTSDFMGLFYQKVREGKSYQVAMSETKRDFILGKGNEIYQYPFYWAPYIMYGQ